MSIKNTKATQKNTTNTNNLKTIPMDLPHECQDWDFLFIYPEDKEFEFCHCTIPEQERGPWIRRLKEDSKRLSEWLQKKNLV